MGTRVPAHAFRLAPNVYGGANRNDYAIDITVLGQPSSPMK